MGMGPLWLRWVEHLWLRWVGHLWPKWAGQLQQSDLGDYYAKKTNTVFRVVTIPVIAFWSL